MANFQLRAKKKKPREGSRIKLKSKVEKPLPAINIALRFKEFDIHKAFLFVGASAGDGGLYLDKKLAVSSPEPDIFFFYNTSYLQLTNFEQQAPVSYEEANEEERGFFLTWLARKGHEVPLGLIHAYTNNLWLIFEKYGSKQAATEAIYIYRKIYYSYSSPKLASLNKSMLYFINKNIEALEVDDYLESLIKSANEFAQNVELDNESLILLKRITMLVSEYSEIVDVFSESISLSISSKEFLKRIGTLAEPLVLHLLYESGARNVRLTSKKIQIKNPFGRDSIRIDDFNFNVELKYISKAEKLFDSVREYYFNRLKNYPVPYLWLKAPPKLQKLIPSPVDLLDKEYGKFKSLTKVPVSKIETLLFIDRSQYEIFWLYKLECLYEILDKAGYIVEPAYISSANHFGSSAVLEIMKSPFKEASTSQTIGIHLFTRLLVIKFRDDFDNDSYIARYLETLKSIKRISEVDIYRTETYAKRCHKELDRLGTVMWKIQQCLTASFKKEVPRILCEVISNNRVTSEKMLKKALKICEELKIDSFLEFVEAAEIRILLKKQELRVLKKSSTSFDLEPYHASISKDGKAIINRKALLKLNAETKQVQKTLSRELGKREIIEANIVEKSAQSKQPPSNAGKDFSKILKILLKMKPGLIPNKMVKDWSAEYSMMTNDFVSKLNSYADEHLGEFILTKAGNEYHINEDALKLGVR